MRSDSLPSLAQAKFLASLFADMHVNGIAIPKDQRRISPTASACLKRHWISGRGLGGKFMDGTEYEYHSINECGLLALERFLFSQRLKRPEKNDVSGRVREAPIVS
jgi:hypothetical protein